MQPCHPERIVVCIDACEERNGSGPRHSNQETGAGGKPTSTLAILKKCAEAFILHKATLNSDNQFAILAFKSSLTSMGPFHNKVAEHLKQISNINPNLPPNQPTQLNTVFQSIYDKVFKSIEDEENEQDPLRIVMFYSRSGTCVLNDNVFSDYKNVVIDILFIHRPVLSVKEKKRISSNVAELQSCQSDKSIFAVAVADSLIALKYTMKFLIHPSLRT